jgi:peptide-methionine (S)-S-oxide reductase
MTTWLSWLLLPTVLLLHPAGTRCFSSVERYGCCRRHWTRSRQRRPLEFNANPNDVTKTSSSCRPRALVEGYVSPSSHFDITAALQRVGFDMATSTATSTDDNDNYNPDPSVFRYAFVKATGMLKLLNHPPLLHDDDSENNAPRWIPITNEKEHVLVTNGWSFLDPDDSEPLSAYNVDAANEQGLYRPTWGKEAQSAIHRLSDLGYSLQSYSKDQIQQEVADRLTEESSLTRRVLLEGATDPPLTKRTHNGHEWNGSIHPLVTEKPGIFVCALGGLPLFSTSDLSPTTATSGWLSFARPLSPDHVELVQPMGVDQRVEVVCARTKCHLGHYFGKAEGYCINASALDFFASKDTNDPLLRQAFQASSLPTTFRSMELLSDKNPSSTPGIKLLNQMVHEMAAGGDTKTILLGAGCFWHVEFALRRLPGVVSTRVGFAGGHNNNPVTTSYEQVCQGQTGHAEVVRVEILPHVLNPRILLDCFLALHDPTKTTAHGKHALGTGQYRSCILVQDQELWSVAQQALDDCAAQLGRELSTELRLVNPIDRHFGEAEERHQRHDEKRLLCEDSASSPCHHGRLSTLDTSEWLSEYGKRKP